MTTSHTSRKPMTLWAIFCPSEGTFVWSFGRLAAWKTRTQARLELARLSRLGHGDRVVKVNVSEVAR